MGTWRIRMTATIEDELEVEAETEEDAIAAAEADWVFVEAHSWETEVISSPEEGA